LITIIIFSEAYKVTELPIMSNFPVSILGPNFPQQPVPKGPQSEILH